MSDTPATKLAQLTVDQELHRDLKAEAAKARKSLREFVTPKLLELVQKSRRAPKLAA